MLKERLKEARKARGFTQKQVAEMLGVTESTYCGYETGKREPDALKLRFLAAALHVSGDYLLEIHANRKTAPEIAGAEKQLLDIFRQLDDEGQRLAIGMLKTLLTEHAQKNSAAVSDEVTA